MLKLYSFLVLFAFLLSWQFGLFAVVFYAVLLYQLYGQCPFGAFCRYRKGNNQ